ncbi:unnamed protein product [Caenorhabditis sp. 36 PRJEB53466]|nr:unnamed protein product [Caenorhabditis sp. 36 PRJEB53466]
MNPLCLVNVFHVIIFFSITAIINCLKNTKIKKEQETKVLQTTPITYETDPEVVEKERKRRIAENRARMKKKREKVNIQLEKQQKAKELLQEQPIAEDSTQLTYSFELNDTTNTALENHAETRQEESQTINSMILETVEDLGEVQLVDHDPNAGERKHLINRQARELAKKKKTEEAVMKQLHASDTLRSPDDTLKNVSSIQFESQLSVIQKKRLQEPKTLLESGSSESQTKTAEIIHRRKSFISSVQSAMSQNSQKVEGGKRYSLITRCYAEFLGTFIFIFCGTMQANVYDIHQPDGLTHAALTHGLATIVVIATFGPISGGHFNPVVSWAAVLVRKLPLFAFPFYVISQFFAGFSANLLSACLQRNRDFIVWKSVGSIKYPVMNDSIEFGYDRVHNSTWEKTIMLTTQLAATSSGATHLGDQNVWWEGLMSETITTYFFVTIILMNAMDTGPTAASPMIIGMMVIANIFATASITGTAMNPVRALSPNVVAEIVLSSASIPAKFWTYHYIYWGGPFLGSTIAVIGYKLLLAKNDRLVP